MLEGDPDTAKQYFDKAKEAGLAEKADINLAELAKLNY